MATDHIRYDLLAQEALRGVLRTVLVDASRNGLPGDHHFCITFDTRAEGVEMSPRLRAQYPEEMTIILQHQFWDLTVTDDRFQVGLSFGGIPERLLVPLAAIKGFFDPSVQFGLQFEQAASDEANDDTDTPSRPAIQPAETPPKADASKAGLPAPTDDSKPDSPPEGGAEVVSLDRFRKK